MGTGNEFVMQTCDHYTAVLQLYGGVVCLGEMDRSQANGSPKLVRISFLSKLYMHSQFNSEIELHSQFWGLNSSDEEGRDTKHHRSTDA